MSSKPYLTRDQHPYAHPVYMHLGIAYGPNEHVNGTPAGTTAADCVQFWGDDTGGYKEHAALFLLNGQFERRAFVFINTGGGETAWGLELTGYDFLVTDGYGDAPTDPDKPCVGAWYTRIDNEDYEAVHWLDFANAAALWAYLDTLPAGVASVRELLETEVHRAKAQAEAAKGDK